MPIDINILGPSVVRTLDQIRSTGVDPNNVDDLPVVPVESRINALYRAIGLPAFKTIKSNKKAETSDQDKEPKEEDKYNIANLFTDKNTTSEQFNDLIKRAQKRNQKFLDPISDDIKEKFLDNEDNSLIKILESRDRGTLFPMVVDGDLKIYPQEKRIAGAFYQKDSEITINNNVYRRPLIELITLLRMRSDGNISYTAQQSINAGFKDLKNKGFFDGTSENLLVSTIITELSGAMVDPKGIPSDINRVIKELGIIRKDYTETFDTTKTHTTGSSPSSAGSSGTGQQEQLEEGRNNIARQNEAKLSLLEFEDIYGKKTKNMREAIMADVIVNALIEDTTNINKEIKKTELQKEKASTKLKQLWNKMDIILGTYSSISGIDIIVIIVALFAISQENLLGLLNNDAIGRLKKIKGKDIGSRQSDVKKALEALEKKVSDIYKKIDDVVNSINQNQKGRKQEDQYVV